MPSNAAPCTGNNCCAECRRWQDEHGGQARQLDVMQQHKQELEARGVQLSEQLHQERQRASSAEARCGAWPLCMAEY